MHFAAAVRSGGVPIARRNLKNFPILLGERVARSTRREPSAAAASRPDARRTVTPKMCDV